MVFSSPQFLFLFLPAFLLLYFFSRFRNLTALLASLAFYAWGAPKVLPYLIALSLSDYILSLAIDRWRSRSPIARALLAISITSNLLLLVYFKYTNFLFEQLSGLAVSFGHAPVHWTQVALPIGISFFTFHKISYVVDVYRGTSPPCRSFIDFLLYILFFPQLIAGPIIRYHDVAEQLRHRNHTMDDFFQGIFRLSLGLGKKILVANVVGQVADDIFARNVHTLTPGQAWTGLLAYAFQIYFDFSGYSDMALGLALMCGFHFRENFNLPYIATTITDFWRRWHISLSSFMREYLYIPLGGNRVPTWRLYTNLWIVFLLSGIWHGANWTFILWGAYHGLFLVLDRLFWSNIARKLPSIVNVALTFVIVLFGWLLFRSPDATYACQYAGRMFNLTSQIPAAQITDVLIPQYLLTNRFWFTLALATAISFAPAFTGLGVSWQRFQAGLSETTLAGAKASCALMLTLLSIIWLSTSSFNPFIYFRF